MKRFRGHAAFAWTVVSCAGFAAAQNPSFELSVKAPSEIIEPAGTVAGYGAVVQVTTTGLLETDPGAQGWSISIGIEGGGAISDATIAGTASEVALTGGFTTTELTSGPGNEGAVSAVVLSFKKPLTLPPSGTADILALEVEVTVPQPVDIEGEPACDPLLSRLVLVNGRQGSGQPVDNKITYLGETILPTLGEDRKSVV